jgi:hypothetical protein
MQKLDRYCLSNLRSQLLDHSVYAEVASVEDLRRFMQDHVFAVWDFMSLLKRLQQDLTCTNVPWFPARNAKAARLINDIVIGEETDVDPDGSYVSHLDLYLRAMEDVGASTHQFDTFRSLARAGTSIEAAMVQTEVPPHVQAFVAHTMMLAQSGSTEEVLAAFFYGREDIIPEMFSRLRKILPGARKTKDPLRHFVYYIERHIELDGDSHGPMGRELLDGLVADSPQKDERALHAAFGMAHYAYFVTCARRRLRPLSKPADGRWAKPGRSQDKRTDKARHRPAASRRRARVLRRK